MHEQDQLCSIRQALNRAQLLDFMHTPVWSNSACKEVVTIKALNQFNKILENFCQLYAQVGLNQVSGILVLELYPICCTEPTLMMMTLGAGLGLFLFWGNAM